MARLGWVGVLLIPLIANAGGTVPATHSADSRKPLGFERLDLNQDGYLTPREATTSLALPGLVQKADADHDGRVDPGELRRFMSGGDFRSSPPTG
ncbi:MAG TPA: hypothetical protein VKA48_06715 [Gammaproteobacteria bacterium]|nr:hypothetical protein [Gammaproteobacteria bacterium]